MTPDDPASLVAIDAYWRAANYLTVGQIYLQENPLLREPLRPEQFKPRLLGHWGTSPALISSIFTSNRLFKIMVAIWSILRDRAIADQLCWRIGLVEDRIAGAN